MAPSAAAMNNLPVDIVDGVSVEAAWVRAIPGDTMSEVFLVVNNTTESPVSVSGVRYAGNNAGMLVSSSGEALGTITIPVHAELYMTEGGVRVLVEGRFDVSNAPILQVELSGEPTGPFRASILEVDQPLPDHHDYVH